MLDIALVPPTTEDLTIEKVFTLKTQSHIKVAVTKLFLQLELHVCDVFLMRFLRDTQLIQ